MRREHSIMRSSTLAFAAALILAGTLSGCSKIPWIGMEKDPTPPTKLTKFAPEVDLRTRWSTKPTKGGKKRRLALVPAASGSRIFVAGVGGRVAALGADSGRAIWQRDTDLKFSAGPSVSGDRLILGTTDGQVVTLSASDGREIWRVPLGSEVLAAPQQTGDGKIIVHTLDDTVRALDGADGAVLWEVSYPAPVLTLRGSGTPIITPSGIVVGLAGGKLLKLHPTDGLPLWEITISPPRGRSELSRISDIDADPVVVGNLIFVGTFNGDLAAVDLESGTILWRRQLSSYAGLSADQNNLYVTDSDDQVWGADPVSGAGRWRQERLKHRGLTAPAAFGSVILVGDGEGYVHLLSQRDGRLLGRTRVAKSPIDVRPLVTSGGVYVQARNGTVAAMSASQSSSGRGSASATSETSAVPADAAGPAAEPPL